MMVFNKSDMQTKSCLVGNVRMVMAKAFYNVVHSTCETKTIIIKIYFPVCNVDWSCSVLPDTSQAVIIARMIIGKS